MKKLFIRSENGIDIAALALRISAGLMLLHGWGKMMNFSEKSETFPDPLHVGSGASLALTVFAEVFCTFFIVSGFFTRLAAIPLFICMLVAVLIVHAGDTIGDRESALAYLLLYAAIFFLGSGKYSLDYIIRKKK